MKNWEEMTAEEHQWGEACEKLMLQMLSATFVHLFHRSRLISLDPAVVEVRAEVREMMEHWTDQVADALGVETVAFKKIGAKGEERDANSTDEAKG